jgi:hypothetical protein
MTADGPTRVLLTLDCGAVDEDSLRALKLLTADDQLELTGLYVEDEDLYRAARLPGATEISSTGQVSVLNHDALALQIDQEAQRARGQFERFARLLKLPYSFRVARGRLVETLIKAADKSDLIVVSRSLRTSGLRARFASHFGPLMEQQRNLLFINEPWRSGRAVIVLCESSSLQSERALAAGKKVAEDDDLRLLMAVPQGFEPADTARQNGAELLVLQEWTEAAIVDLCETSEARLLVVPAGQHLDWRTMLLRLVDRLSCSLLRLE